MANASDHDDERARASARFARRAQSIASLLGHRLDTAMATYDLTEKRLWAAHRDMAELHRWGGAPTPAGYWESTANPRAQRFLGEMIDVIAAEEEELMRAFQQFAFSIAERSRRDAPPTDDNPLNRDQPAGGSDIDLATAIAVAQAGVDGFVAAANVGARINEVGAWWQGKLRRKAILTAAGRLLTAPVGRYDAEVAAAEMRLLETPPWSLDDRLLSAFELAHSDLRDHIETRRSDLRRRVHAMLSEADGNARRRADKPDNRGRRRASPEAASESDAIELR